MPCGEGILRRSGGEDDRCFSGDWGCAFSADWVPFPRRGWGVAHSICSGAGSETGGIRELINRRERVGGLPLEGETQYRDKQAAGFAVKKGCLAERRGFLILRDSSGKQDGITVERTDVLYDY